MKIKFVILITIIAYARGFITGFTQGLTAAKEKEIARQKMLDEIHRHSFRHLRDARDRHASHEEIVRIREEEARFYRIVDKETKWQ